MRISRPNLIDRFVCLADACPDTCCAAWEIELDRASAERYAASSQLRSLLCDDGLTLRQSECGACPHLEASGLCRAYAERPSVCREYPLHRHDLGSRRELGLSFSCPALAKMILAEREPIAYLEYDDPSVYPDTYSEIDPDLLPIVLAERQSCLSIAADPSLSIFDRLSAILSRSFSLEKSMRGKTAVPKRVRGGSDKRRRSLFAGLLSLCLRFEYLDPRHRDLFASARALVLREDFSTVASAFDAYMGERRHEYEKWISQSLRQSYGQAAETRDPLLRAKTVVAETLILYLLGLSHYAGQGSLTLDDQADVFRIFSREYEHSTENPSLFREKLRRRAFSLEKFLIALQ